MYTLKMVVVYQYLKSWSSIVKQHLSFNNQLRHKLAMFQQRTNKRKEKAYDSQQNLEKNIPPRKRSKITENTFVVCPIDQMTTHYEAETMRPLYWKSTTSEGTMRETMFVVANMGMGKTSQCLVPYIQQEKQRNANMRICFISFRKTFSAELKKKFPECTLYSDKTGCLDDDELIVQAESLHRIGTEKGPFNVVVLDECESIFEQFNSKFSHRESWNVFDWLLKSSQRVICLDANLSKSTVELMEKFRPKQGFTHHRNTYRNCSENRFFTCKEKDIWLSLLVKSIENGEKIVVPTNSKGEAKALYKLIVEDKNLLSSEEVGIYTADTPDDKTRKLHFEDVNKFWSSYKALIYSPTVTAGCSFEKKHYDKVFALFNYTTTTVEASRQMLKRVRDISTKEYYICFDSRSSSITPGLPTEISEIESYLRERAFNVKSEFNSDWLVRQISDDGRSYEFPFKDTYYWVTIHNIRRKRKSRNSFMKRFVKQEQATGANFVAIDDNFLLEQGISNESKKTEKSMYTKAKKETLELEFQKVASAEEYDDITASSMQEKVEKNESLLDSEKLALKKWKLRKCYGYFGPMTSEWVKTYDPSRVRTEFRNQRYAYYNGRTDTKSILKTVQTQERTSYEMASHSLDILKNTNHKFDQFRYALTMLNGAGYDNLWDSPNISIEEDGAKSSTTTTTIVERKQLESNLRLTIQSLVCKNNTNNGSNQSYQQQQSQMQQGNYDAQYISSFDAGAAVPSLPQHPFISGINSYGDSGGGGEYDKEKMIYLLSVFEKHAKREMQQPLEKWDFKKLLGFTNGALESTFGVKISPLKRGSKCYVLKHLHNFQLPSATADDEGTNSIEGDGNGSNNAVPMLKPDGNWPRL
jgi:hypothetical protein